MKKGILLSVLSSLVFISTYSQTIAEEYFFKGLEQVKLKEYKRAIKKFNKAIELDTTSANSYYERAKTKAILKDYQGAITDYTEFIILSHENYDFHYEEGDAYYRRGNAKFELRDKNGACLDWKMGAELGSIEANDIIKYNCK